MARRESVNNMDRAKGFLWGIGACVTGIAIAWLLGIVHDGEQANMKKLAETHQAELIACLTVAKDTGETCRIEYLKDRTDTIYGAKVVREAK